MRQSPSSNFKIRLDDDRPDSIFQEEMENLRLDRLNRRITVLAVLLPLLMAAALVLGYLHVQRQFAALDTSGTQNIEALTADLEARFSSLSLKTAALEESISKNFSPINEIFLEFEKNTGAINDELGQLKARLAALDEKKADRSVVQSLGGTLDVRLAKALTPLQEQLRGEAERRASASAALDDRLGELQRTVTALTAELETYDEAISTLSSAMTNNKMTILGLKTDQQSYRESLDKTIQQLGDSLVALREKLEALQVPAPAPAAAPPAPEAAPAPQSAPVVQEPPPASEPIAPGQILEQDIE